MDMPRSARGDDASHIKASDGNVIRILLVDSSPIMQAGIRAIIESARKLRIVAAGNEFIDADRVQQLDPDLIVINSLSMPPDWHDRVDFLAKRGSGSPRRILMIVSDREDPAIRRVRAAVDGTVLLQAQPDEFLAAISLVAAGYFVAVPEQSAADPSKRQVNAKRSLKTSHNGVTKVLTNRELDILAAVADGCTNAEIAQRMTLSESTVKSHVQSLLTKLGLPNRASAVAMAYEAGVLS